MMSKLRILCLEDDENDVGQLRRRLKEIADITACDRRALFELALAEPWHIIIIDYRLHDITGEEAIQIARKLHPDTPVILVTGSLYDPQAVSIACQYGAVDCLCKDRLDRLRMAVERAEERRQTSLEKKRLEEERLRDQRLETVGHWASGLSHDFNGILQVFLMGTEALRGEVTESGGKILDLMDGASRRGREMVKQLMAYVRGGNGTSFKSVAVEYILGEIRQLLQSGAFPSNIRSDVQIGIGTPPILCDATQIHQVIMNLVTNSRDCFDGKAGEILIRAQLAKLDDESLKGDFVAIEVQDNGPGIPDTIIGKIFDPFVTTKPKGQGTGMGLAIVKAITLGHGGDIKVESSPAGTKFTMYVPAAESAAVKTKDLGKEAAVGNGRTIVLADDQESICAISAMILEDAGYKVLPSANGIEALAHFRSLGKIDLLITDVVMPILSGPQLIETLRAQGFTCPCILVSGYDSNDVQSDCPVLSKPVSKEALLKACADALAPPTSAP